MCNDILNYVNNFYQKVSPKQSKENSLYEIDQFMKTYVDKKLEDDSLDEL